MTTSALAAIPTQPGYNGVIDPSRGAGSDTTYFQMQAFADLYNGAPGCKVPSDAADGADFSECSSNVTGTIATENWDHDEIQNAAPFGVGSTNGLKQLCGTATSTQPVHWARSSREPKTTDCTGLTGSGFARDGFSFLTWPTDKKAYVTNGSNQVTQGPPGRGCLPNEAPPDTTLTALGFAGRAPSIVGTNCTGFLSVAGNRRLSDKNIKDIWAHSGGSGTALTDWCQLNNSPGGATSIAGDSNDPTDANPVYFPTCSTAMPIALWDVNTGSGTFGFFRDNILGGADPNTFANNGVGGPGGPPIQENDANEIAKAGASILQRSMHWGSWGRYKAAPFTAQGADFRAVGPSTGNAADFLAPSIGTIGKNTGCTNSTCYLYARILYNVYKTADTSGAETAAKAFFNWLCRSTAVGGSPPPPGNHSINDDTGKSFDEDLKKIYDRFFIARLGGITGTFGPCDTKTT
jgi:ABC-type phosphate transport system substrate-binding protein